MCTEKRKEKTTPCGVSLMRSLVLYRAAHNHVHSQEQPNATDQSHWAKLRMAHRTATKFKPPSNADTAKLSPTGIQFLDLPYLYQQISTSTNINTLRSFAVRPAMHCTQLCRQLHIHRMCIPRMFNATKKILLHMYCWVPYKLECAGNTQARDPLH